MFVALAFFHFYKFTKNINHSTFSMDVVVFY
jgi:hypothetical protein